MKQYYIRAADQMLDLVMYTLEIVIHVYRYSSFSLNGHLLNCAKSRHLMEQLGDTLILLLLFNSLNRVG